MNSDQKTLVHLYEQITEGEPRILKLEVEYAKIIADHAIKDLKESMERRIYNRGKIRGERLSDFAAPKVGQATHLFKDESTSIVSAYASIVRLDVFNTLVYFEARRANDLKAKDIKTVIIHPHMLVQYTGEASKISVPFSDMKTLEEKLQKTIEDTFVVRYNEYTEPETYPTSKYVPADRKPWAEWRKDQLKFEKLKTNLPELEGIF